MDEYTVTYPVHLGQRVWVDSRVLPTFELNPTAEIPKYLYGEVRSLIVQRKGNSERKFMKLKITANWLNRPFKPAGEYSMQDRYFKFAIGAIGKTVFTEEPT